MLRLIETRTMCVLNTHAHSGTDTMGKLLASCQNRGGGMSHSKRLRFALLVAPALAAPMFAQASEANTAATTPALHPAMAHAAPISARALTELEKIQALISNVEKSQGLQFIRNGSVHDPAAAAGHLRLKWRNAGKRVHSAEEFIRYCATGSSMSGKPYQIRFASGKVENSADYFHAQLRVLETPGSKAQAAALQAATVRATAVKR